MSNSSAGESLQRHAHPPLVQTIQQCLDSALIIPELPLMVAVSGGLDSLVLLHACVRMGRPGAVIALHVNHGLMPDACKWQHAVHEFCKQWQIECRSTRVQVQAQGKGIEAAARDARYAWLLEQSRATGVLLLAHHAHDQSETVLLNALRGSGPRGLQAMRSVSDRQGVRLVRPLLGISKGALHDYATQAGMSWQCDESNNDLGLDRNYLRHKVLEPMRERWPSADVALGRVAQLQCSTRALLTDLADIDLARCTSTAKWPLVDRGWPVLDLSEFANLPHRRLLNALLTWCERLQLPHLPSSRLASLVSVLRAGQGSVAWADSELRYYRRRLYLHRYPGRADDQLQVTPINASQDLVDQGRVDFACPNRHVRVWVGARVAAVKTALCAHRLQSSTLQIRSRRAGDRIQLSGHHHHVTLKTLFQAQGIPQWARASWPLFVHAN